MKANRLFLLLFLCVPFFATGMKTYTIPSPYFDLFRLSEHRPGSPELFNSVKKKLEEYIKARQTIINFSNTCNLLNIKYNEIDFDAVLDNFPLYSKDVIKYILNCICLFKNREPKFELLLAAEQLKNKSMQIWPKEADKLEAKYNDFVQNIKYMSNSEVLENINDFDTALADLEK